MFECFIILYYLRQGGYSYVLVTLVCLFISRITPKNYEQIFVKFSEEVRCTQTTRGRSGQILEPITLVVPEEPEV